MLLITEYSLRIAHRGCPVRWNARIGFFKMLGCTKFAFFLWGGSNIGYPLPSLKLTVTRAPEKMDGRERVERPIFHGCSLLVVSHKLGQNSKIWLGNGSWQLRSCFFFRDSFGEFLLIPEPCGKIKEHNWRNAVIFFYSWVAITNQLGIRGCSFVCLMWFLTFYH